jgi:hypothetical protein
MGFEKLKSKLRVYRISASSFINFSILTCYLSSSERSIIIFEKLGEIGYSSFAAISMETVASRHIFSRGKVYQPMTERYLSMMEQATNKVSFL